MLTKTIINLIRKVHNDAYTPFQYKLWAEMYAKGEHNSLGDPPHAAMFNHETKPQCRSAQGNNLVTSDN